VRDDDLCDSRCIGGRASAPEADGCAAHPQVQIAIDDGHDEASRAYDLRRRRLAPNRGYLRAAELALRSVRSAARSDEPDEEKCDP
jgi:hypothetical protein